VARPPDTLILSAAEIASLMAPADYLAAVETGFRAAGEGRAHSPPPLSVQGLAGAFHAKAASLRLDRPYVALKFNGNFPGNPAGRGLPTIQGAILLCDGGTGSLLAVMDSAEVTLRRTAAATALAARYLARAESATILVCGCGPQGEANLLALAEILPLRRVFLWDLDSDRSAALAASVDSAGRIAVEVATDLAEAARRSDVVVACTTSRTPYLDVGAVRRGTFVAAVGADSPEKSEIHPSLMAAAKIVTDVRAQCAEMGDLHHALAAGALSEGQVHADLAELVLGVRPGRTCEAEITLFDSTGTALQDVAAAATIFERAGRTGLGRSVRLAAP
jgi:ornithine cyclodeaminase/alanine dehydrogenase-like protein (mu-crystallin family)